MCLGFSFYCGEKFGKSALYFLKPLISWNQRIQKINILTNKHS